MSNNSSPVNWLFLGELIVVVIATAAFLFYWNRLLGSVVGALIRLGTWKWYNAYISFGALQLSPLAGRIAFRDIEYHSSNMSFRALHGNITFRFWKVRVRQDGDSGSSNSKRARLPCRIILNIEGAEVFCFNRTPAYDAIVDRMKKREAKQREERDGKLSPQESATSTSRAPGSPSSRLRRRQQSPPGDSEYSSKPEVQAANRETEDITIETAASGVSWFQEALPMEINIVTGSVIIGSDATPMILITDFKRANGVVDVSEPQSHCDYYKLSVNLGLQDVTVLMRTNPDHTGSLLLHGKRAYEDIITAEPKAAKEPPSELVSRSAFSWLAKRIPTIFMTTLPPAPVTGMPHERIWRGLARYRLDDDVVESIVHKEERQYAKVTTILKTSMLDLSYVSDAPGPVPEPSEAQCVDPNDTVGNVEPAPEYSVELAIHGGMINYGPWADRQRDMLQKAFIPQSFFDTEPRAKLKPGETRLHATLVVNVSFTDKTMLRIPTREPSKDWMFEGKHDNERRYGWLDVAVGPSSFICYTQAQVPQPSGYDSMLILHFDSLDIASSVNLQSFVVAKTCKLSITMPTPLAWNAQRNWGLDLTLDTPDIRLMREHVALISDLSRDWSSGTATDFRHFVPVHYSFRLALLNYAVHLYVNDFNIVDVPRSRDANAFCDLSGPRLDAFVAVASTRYRPEFSVVPFTIDGKGVCVSLGLPSWDTHRTFGAPTMELGKIGTLGVSGSYRYYSSPRPDHQEKLKLHISGQHVAFIALGWAIRRLFCVKDNYFGGFTQFSTMQEFLEKFDHSPDSVGDPVMEKYRPGRSDSFAVRLTVDVTDSLVLMSDQIYDAKHGIAIPVPQLQLDLKTNEFQMDMTLDVAPTYAIACPSIASSYKEVAAPLARSQDVVFVEGIFIKANRLFGPQPRATTYFCLWELSFMRISAFLSPEFKTTLAAVGAAVGYNYSDYDNAPASIYIAKTPPDATFVKLSVDHVTALLSSGLDGVAVELPDGLFIDTSSVASQSCGSVLGFGIPTVTAHVLHRKSPSKPWKPVGVLGTGVSIDIFRIPEGWEEESRQQNAFLKEQDAPTRRIAYLYGGKDGPQIGQHVHQIYVPHPKLADASWQDGTSVYTSGSRRLEPGPSSPDQSDDSRPSIPLSRMSRKTTSLSLVAPSMAVPPEYSDDNSLGDESDSVSSVDSFSSHSSHESEQDNIHMEASAVLEERLKAFRDIYQRADKTFTRERSLLVPPEEEAEREKPYDGVTINNGSIFRIVVEQTSVDLNPQTVQSAHALVGAMNRVIPSNGIIMDQLLKVQVSAVRKRNVRPSASLYDIDLPMADVRLVLGSFTTPEAIVQLLVQGASSRIVNDPASASFDPNTPKPKMNVALSIQDLRAVGGRNERQSASVSLSDVLDIPLDPRYHQIVPDCYLLAHHLDVTFHSTEADKTVQAKFGSVNVHSATYAMPAILGFIDSWKDVATSLPEQPCSHPQAHLICAILLGLTGAADLPIPEFAQEASYGLHVDDIRNIRRDLGWFTLTRLRECMGHTEIDCKPGPPLPDMARLVVEELARLDAPMGVTEELVLTEPFLKKAFGQNFDELIPDKHPTRSMSLFVGVESLSLRHYGHLLESNTVASSLVGLQSVTLLTRKTTCWAEDRPFINVNSAVKLQKCEVDLQTSIMAVIQALLTHFDTHRKEIRELEVVQVLDHASDIITSVQLGQVNLGAVAGGMRLDVILDKGDVSAALMKRRRPTDEFCMSQNQEETTANLSVVELKAALSQVPTMPPHSTAPSTDRPPDRPVITSAFRDVHGTLVKLDNHIDTDIDTTKILLGVEAVTFESRPLPRAFYEFGRAWRNEHYPLYKPTVDQFKVVMDRRRTPLSTPTPSVAPRCEIIRGRDLALDLCIKSMDFQARLAKTLRLGWETGKLYATRSGTDDYVQFGLLVDPQTLGLYPNSKRTKKGSSVLRLPSIKVKGLYANSNDRRNMTADVRFGLFTGNIKPTVLDRLLLVHQQVGSDIVEAVSEYSSERTPSPVVITKPKKDPLLFNINASFEGIRVGLRADDVATTLLFEALNLELQTSVDNAVRSNLEWSLTANPVSLSLIRLEDDLDHGTKPARGTRFMSMTCDVTARETAATETHPGKLNMRLARVHALMHLAALSEASELIRSWSSEITVLREVHRAEMEEVKAQTSKVLKKIDAARSSSKTSVVASSADPITPSTDLTIVTDFKNPSLETWLSARQIKFQIHDLGIAIPLGTASPIDVGWHESHKSSGPALLYSINDIALNTSRNETARFTVQQMSLAFVDAFDPLQERHFNVQVHKARNIMTLPNILAEAQRMSDTETWSVNLHCAATDFKLKLMPDVAEFMGQLADMYEDGKAQLSAMEREYAEWTKSAGTEDTTESVKTKYEQTGTPVPTATGKRLVVRMSFRFDSGVVQLRRVRQGPAPSALWRERQKLKKSKDFDEIVLPTVSVWLDYTGPGPDDEKIGTLLLNTAVHESKNTLQPTILLFTGEVISHLDERSEKKRLAAAAAAAYGRPALHAVAVSPKLSPALSTAKLSPRLSTRALPDTPSVSSFTDRAVERIAESPTGKLRVRVTLRIDSSKLRLSCANSLMETYLDLKWASGGFSVATLLGGHDPTTLVGTVSGVGAELSYDFKDRPHHITAATKDLAFTVTMTSGNSRSLSVVLDTELSIQFDLLALNAWLIFKAGWIDNAPKMASFATPAVPSTPQNPHMPHLPHLPHSHASNMSRASSSPHTPAIIVASPPRAKLGIAVLVRLRTVDFEAKLGVTTAQLKLWPIVVRTVSNGEMTTLEATIGKTQITAEGQIWGDVTSDGIKFKTVRRSSRATGTSDPTVLSIIIVAALLTGNMFIGDSNIVGFSLDPTTVSLKDNWRNYAPHDPNAEIGLDFVVNAGKFSGVLRLPMIPRLLSQFYTMLSVIESQTTMATKRSDALKERQQRTDAVGVKPATTVMIPQQDPVAHPNLIRTIQHMRLGIAEVNVGLFVDDYDDGTKADFFHFYVGKVKADLERREERPSSFPLRKLRLYVAKIVWQTSSGSAANRAEKELRAQLRTAPEPTATTTSPPSPSSPSPPHTGRQPTPLEIIAAANKTRPRDVAVLPGATITLDSTESTPPPILNYDFNIVWDAGAGDLKLLPNFYQLASNSIKRSAASIKEVRDAQQTMRTSEWDQKPSVPPVERAEDKDKDKEKEKEKDKEKGEDKEKDENKDKDKDKESPSSVIDDGKLKYVNRDPNQDPGRLIPRIRMLGDTTGDAAMLIPMIREAASNFGPYSHRFLTLPLEDAMNLLVKLYQRQMPDEMSDEMAGDGASPDTTPATPVTPGRVAPTAPAPEAVTPATSTTPAVAAATLTPTTPTTPANLAP